MSLARNVFVQTTFTLGSRLLGFVRDLALNYRFGGQGPLMDCWATAQMLPNLFRRLFAEGAFAQAFVKHLVGVALDGQLWVRQKTKVFHQSHLSKFLVYWLVAQA